MDKLLVCDCGNQFKNSLKYSVYNKNFCCMDCLTLFKNKKEDEMRKAEEERVAKLGGTSRFGHIDHCGAGTAF